MSDIVGQIKVRVRPDTSLFDKELLAKLNAIERGAKPLRVNVDDDHLERSMRRAMDRAGDAVEDINVKMRLDSDDFERQFRELNDRIRNEFGRDLEFDPDLVLDDSSIRRYGDSLDDLALTMRRLRDSVDQLNDSVRDNSDEVYRMGNSVRELATDLDDLDFGRTADDWERNSTRFRRSTSIVGQAWNELTRQLRRNVIRSVLDNTAGAFVRFNRQLADTGRALSSLNIFSDVTDMFDRMLVNMDRIMLTTTQWTAGLLHFGGAVGALLPPLASFGVGLAEIVRGYALVLPGAFMGMAVGAIAFGVALADFNNQLPGITDRFKAMADTMRPAFWNEAREPMREMFERLLPGIARGMDQVSGRYR